MSCRRYAKQLRIMNHWQFTGIRQMAPGPSGSVLQVGVFDKTEPRRKVPQSRMSTDDDVDGLSSTAS